MLVLAGLVLGFIAFIALVNWVISNPKIPRFESVSQPFVVPQYQQLRYEFLSTSPFEGDRMWISVSSGTNGYHCYLYDIERKAVLGELFNASPAFMTRDQSMLLCVSRSPASHSPVALLNKNIKALVRVLLHGKADFSNDDIETVWGLNLQHGGATRLGSLSQGPRSGSSFVPSPSFRYGYNKPTASFETPDLFICDLEKRVLLRRSVDGWPEGWWSDSEIIFKDSTNNFMLYDVAADKSSPLLSAAPVADSFRKGSLPGSPGQGSLFFIWNGKENEFYLTDAHQRWLATNSYLFKIERPGAGLKLMAADFKFEWSDHFTPGGAGYVYSGREPTNRSSGVFFRDLRTQREITLVDSDQSRSFSLPNVYRDTVIYTRSNQLWQVMLNGSNRTRLFPPPGFPTTER